MKKALFIIILLALGLYFQVYFFNYTYYDDDTLILDKREYLSNWSNIPNLFTEDVFIGTEKKAVYYRPFLTTSFLLNTFNKDQSAGVYLIGNVLIHIIACFSLFLLLKEFFNAKLSLFSSLVFLVHPALIQAVAWIPGRNDSLLGVFVFLTIWALEKWRKLSREKWLCLGYIFTLGALLTKESGVVLILFFYIYLLNKFQIYKLIKDKKLIVSIWKNRKYRFILLNLLIVLPLLLGFYLYLRYIFLTGYQFQSINVNNLSVLFIDLIQYLGKVILPFNLSPLPNIVDTGDLLGFISAIILIKISLWLWKNEHAKEVVLSWLWFILWLIPSLVSMEDGHQYKILLEHRLYVPLAGILFLLITYIQNKKFKSLGYLFFSLIFTFSLLTYLHTKNYVDDLSFWKFAADKSPTSALVHTNFGAAYIRRFLYDDAKIELMKAYYLYPDQESVKANLGVIAYQQSDYKSAVMWLENEWQTHPTEQLAYILGLTYKQLGDEEKAQEFLNISNGLKNN